MKKYINALITLMVTLFASASFAFTPPPAPPHGWYVSDQTGKLSTTEIAALNQKIEQVSKATKNEYGILFLNTMDGDNIEDVAYATFNAWGIGKKGLDNGCLIVVALKERKSRIETGKGVGGEVTDVQALQILKTNLNPYLKRGEYAAGFSSTLDALNALIESRNAQPASAPTASSGCDVAPPHSNHVGTVVLVVFLFIAAMLYNSSRRRSARERARLDELDAELERERNNLRPAPKVPVERPHTITNQQGRVMVNGQYVFPHHVHPMEPVHTVPRPAPKVPVKTTVAVVAGVAAGALAIEAAEHLAEERRAKARREREREEENRRQQERDDEDRRRRQRDDDDRRSSSSSLFDSSGSSSSSDSGFGGGFGGGFDGGGGASSDF